MLDINVECVTANKDFVFVPGKIYKSSTGYEYVHEEGTDIPWALNEDLKVRKDYYDLDSEVLATFKQVK